MAQEEEERELWNTTPGHVQGIKQFNHLACTWFYSNAIYHKLHVTVVQPDLFASKKISNIKIILMRFS